MSTTNDTSTDSGCLLKILIGCGLVVVLIVLLGLGGCFWLSRPGKQIETTAIQGDTSLGTMAVEDLLEDEGFGGLVEGFVNEVNAQNDRNLPAWWPRKRSTAKDMGIVIPQGATVTFEQVDGVDRPPFVAAVNFRGWVRPIKLIFSFLDADDEDVRDYRGHRVISADDAFLMAFHQSTLLVSDHPDALFRVIDRLVDGTGTGIEPLPAGALPDGDWDAAGGMRNDDGRLDELLAGLARGEPAADTPIAGLGPDTTLGFGIDIVSTDHAVIEVDLSGIGSNPSAATAHLENLVARLEPWLTEHGMPTTSDVYVVDDRASVAFEIHGLLDAILDGWDEVDDFDPDFDRSPAREDEAPVEGGAPP